MQYDIQTLIQQMQNADTIKVDRSWLKAITNVVSLDRKNHFDLLADNISSKGSSLSLLDFGCGSASYRDRIKNMGYRYRGVDHEETTGFIGRREADDPDIELYDGSMLPFDSESFDVVFSLQVFEHVVNPQAAMSECSRVLRRGGAFIGSVSFLEPYHAMQTQSYTPFGFMLLGQASGLVDPIFSANRDVLQIIMRKLQIQTGNTYSNTPSDYPSLADMIPAIRSLDLKTQRIFELNFCGSFSYMFTKE